jgi:hypothetical protein
MDWGLLKKRVVDEIARLSAAGSADGRADALEECLRLAQDARLAREALADLRAALDRAEARTRPLEADLLEAERRFCRCGERRRRAGCTRWCGGPWTGRRTKAVNLGHRDRHRTWPRRLAWLHVRLATVRQDRSGSPDPG